MERDELVQSLLQAFARHRKAPGKPADYWLPPEVYDPGIWGAQDLYLYIMTDGSLGGPRPPNPDLTDWLPARALPGRPPKSVPAQPKAAAEPGAVVGSLPPPPPPSLRPLRNEAVHAVLVGELQAEYFADDLTPPIGSRSWTPDELRTFFESGGSAVPST